MDRLSLLGRAQKVPVVQRPHSKTMLALLFAASLIALRSGDAGAQQPLPGESKSEQGGGFLHRAYRDADGEHKYVVFVPWNYRPDTLWPVILYLHGAGERGTDGLVQTTVGLGPYVKARAQTFPFIVVFPQCEETRGRILTAWSPTSPDGKRALAILDQVEHDFAIDLHKQILTGWSMGGYGAWSMAAAMPARWSAVVPVSAGGDTALAPKLRDVTAWAFHGMTDQIVRVQESRRMIEAIRAAGGRPLYTEIPDAGHDVWKVVYADERLYQWMESPRPAAPGPATGAPNVPPPTALASPGSAPSVPVIPGTRLGAQSSDQPFVAALVVPNAVSVRMGNDMLAAVAHSAPRRIPPDALVGRINDIMNTTEASGRNFTVQFSNIGYSAQVERVFIKAYAPGRVNIQLGLRNVALTIGTTYVQGSSQSAVAGPISVLIGHRYPVWLNFDVTPYVREGRLRLQPSGGQFEIPNDNWYVSAPYGVSARGLGMTEQRVSSSLVEGIYGQKYRIQQEALGIIPRLLAAIEQRLDVGQATQLASSFWPLPVYRPRLKVWPQEAVADENGVSIVMGLMAAAADPRKAPREPRTVEPAGVRLAAIPRSTDFQAGIAPSTLTPLTQMLIDADVARIHVLDIPNQAFASFVDRKALAQILPDIAKIPETAEIWAELSLAAPMEVRSGERQAAMAGAGRIGDSHRPTPPLNVTALKPSGRQAPGPPQLNRRSPTPGAVSGPAFSRETAAKVPEDSVTDKGLQSIAFVFPKIVISLAYKDSPETVQWKRYADFEFAVSQHATASVVRKGYSGRFLRVGWSGDPSITATAHFVDDSASRDQTISTDKLRDLFADAWKTWSHNGVASQALVTDIDLGFSKLRLDGVDWAPPVLSLTFDYPGIKISNASKTDLTYQVKGPYSEWSPALTLKPGQANDYNVADPVLFRRKSGDEFTQLYTLPVGDAFQFRSAAPGGPPGLFKIDEPAATR